MDHLPRLRRRSLHAAAAAAAAVATAAASATSPFVVPAADPMPCSAQAMQPQTPTQDQVPVVNLTADPSPPSPPPSTGIPRANTYSSTLKSTLRSLRFHTSKRARSPNMPQATAPPVAIVHHEGSKELEEGGVSLQSPGVTGEVKALPKKRRLPQFLNQSTQEILWKFSDLQFLEADRNASADASGDPDHKWATFALPRTRKANMLDRYANIKPWNWNRVRLDVPHDTLNYVNASAVTLTSPSNPGLPPLEYIAMQGPTLASLDYVWRMVAEQRASASDPGPIVIVQLTKMAENGMTKCFPYFPVSSDGGSWKLNEGDKWSDGWHATLSFAGSEFLEGGTIVRTRLLLRVGDDAEPRDVWHLLYQRWPDFGVPAPSDCPSFFELMRLSREHNTADNRRIIHCSAGVGRTGTFISLEHLLRELDAGALESVDQPRWSGNANHADEGGVSLSPPPSPPLAEADPVFDTVDRLREQRRQMVQSEAQFVFIYAVLRRLWLEKYWGRMTGVEDGTEPPAPKRMGIEDPCPQ